MPFDSPARPVEEWIIAEFRKARGIDLSSDALARQRIREAAEKASAELSAQASVEINLPFITADSSGPQHLSLTLTRAALDQLTRGR